MHIEVELALQIMATKLSEAVGPRLATAPWPQTDRDWV